MTVELISFTENGGRLAAALAAGLERSGHRATCTRKGERAEEWTAAAFRRAEALIFVGAAGIAVRSVAPHLVSKARDPAVVVVDELGRFAVPILSGHLGGANDLARKIAGACGAQAIITTATDVRGLFPVDQWARIQGLRVEEAAKIKMVSAKVLAGETIRLHSDFPISGTPPQGVELEEEGPWEVQVTLRGEGSSALKLVPPALTLGVGCKRGTEAQVLERAFETLLSRENLSPLAVNKVCSIHLKKNEPGLLAFCQAHGLKLETFSAGELAALPGEFPSSDFVRQVTGVDNVCQRAAVLGSGVGKLLGEKYQGEGVTMAVALGDFPLDWRIYE